MPNARSLHRDAQEPAPPPHRHRAKRHHHPVREVHPPSRLAAPRKPCAHRTLAPTGSRSARPQNFPHSAPPNHRASTPQSHAATSTRSPDSPSASPPDAYRFPRAKQTTHSRARSHDSPMSTHAAKTSRAGPLQNTQTRSTPRPRNPRSPVPPATQPSHHKCPRSNSNPPG